MKKASFFLSGSVFLFACLGPIPRRPYTPRISQSAIHSSENPRAGQSEFRIPLANAKILSRYGYRKRRFHTGIDLRASRKGGEPVLAAREGQVASVRRKGGYGNMVLIRHPNGYLTLYAHLRTIHVMEGQGVPTGGVLGTVGQTGRATTPHLHFEIMTPTRKHLDPYPFLFR